MSGEPISKGQELALQQVAVTTARVSQESPESPESWVRWPERPVTRAALLLKNESGGLVFSLYVLLVKIPCFGNCLQVLLLLLYNKNGLTNPKT